jgi:pimeloyl-ACP methyl ester carboxylesterase
MTKPDGGRGWAHYFVNQGYEVLMVDAPHQGRSTLLNPIGGQFAFPAKRPCADFTENELTAPSKRLQGMLGWPSANLHTQWPGVSFYLSCHVLRKKPVPKELNRLTDLPQTGQREDPIFERYFNSTSVLMMNKYDRQTSGQEGLAQLLAETTGKAILIGHGSGATLAWLTADMVPHLVEAIVAIEPDGPPFGRSYTHSANGRVYSKFCNRQRGERNYGISDIPLTFDPPPVAYDVFGPQWQFSTDQADHLPFETRSHINEAMDGVCLMQAPLDYFHLPPPRDEHGNIIADTHPPPDSPYRQLMNIKRVKNQVLITAEASFHTTFDWATVNFMEQAGVPLQWIKLADHNIRGNGHLCFLEKNSSDIAGLIHRWLERSGVGRNADGPRTVRFADPDSDSDSAGPSDPRPPTQEQSGNSSQAESSTAAINRRANQQGKHSSSPSNEHGLFDNSHLTDTDLELLGQASSSWNRHTSQGNRSSQDFNQDGSAIQRLQGIVNNAIEKQETNSRAGVAPVASSGSVSGEQRNFSIQN